MQEDHREIEQIQRDVSQAFDSDTTPNLLYNHHENTLTTGDPEIDEELSQLENERRYQSISGEKSVEASVKILLQSGMDEKYCIDALYSILRKEYGMLVLPKDEAAVKMKLEQLTKGLFFDTAKNRALSQSDFRIVYNRIMEALAQVAATERSYNSLTGEKITEASVKILLQSGMDEKYCIDALYSILQKEYNIHVVPENEPAVKMKLENLTKGLFFDTAKNRTLSQSDFRIVYTRIMEALEQVAKENQGAA